MNRREFLAALLSAPLVIKAAGIEEVVSILAPEMVSYDLGYSMPLSYAWLRTTIKLPDGREFHNLTQKSGDWRDNPIEMFEIDKEIMKKHMEKYA